MSTRKSCRHCGYHWFWHLKDGRYKCRQCGRRQSFRSVWDASRLSEASKRRLLEYFVLGVSVNRLHFRGPASIEATARFYLHIRGVLGLLEGCSLPFGVVNPGHFAPEQLQNGPRQPTSSARTIIFKLELSGDRIHALPVEPARLSEIYGLIRSESSFGELLHIENDQVYASVAIRGKKVVIDAPRGKLRSREQATRIEVFWDFAKKWLYSRRAISEKFLHLYLAETLFRFNHHDQDLYPLINRALKETDILQVQPFAVRIDPVK